jgi:hypothetical protein
MAPTYGRAREPTVVPTKMTAHDGQQRRREQSRARKAAYKPWILRVLPPGGLLIQIRRQSPLGLPRLRDTDRRHRGWVLPTTM